MGHPPANLKGRKERLSSPAPPRSLERTVAGICGINTAWLARWNQPESNDLGFDCAFISDVVYVAATTIDKCHPHCVDVRRATGIVPVIMSDRSRGDND